MELSADISACRTSLPYAPSTDATLTDTTGFDDSSTNMWRRIEGPTWVVIAAVYGGWLTLLAATAWLPLWLVLPVLAVWVTWHGHLQHELIHGHPTRNKWINGLLGLPPLGLVYPYSIFRRTHLVHHAVEILTEPDHDPETFYVSPERWAATGPIKRKILAAYNSMLGRFLMGPAFATLALARSELRRLVAGDAVAWLEWGSHGVLVAGVLYVVETVGGIAPWIYLVGVAYPGMGLLMMRSFLEHRPAKTADERTAIVEGGWFWTLLYLGNNFHFVHHERPGMPWYDLARVYALNRDAIAARNGGYVFRSYGDVARRYFLRPKDQPVYPL